MSGLNVKNTIVERLLEIIAPHPCFGCGKIGFVLCDDCKYDIIHEPFVGCILCGAVNSAGVCEKHRIPLEKVWVLRVRSDVLENAINKLKFNNVKAAAQVFAVLFDTVLPLFPKDMRIIPVPTLRKHVRKRGYGQVELIGKHLAAIRGHEFTPLLERKTKSVQHTSSKADREQQAATAFVISSGTMGDLRGRPVLLIDDVITTGSTIAAAATLLAKAGATVYVAALAYQPLD